MWESKEREEGEAYRREKEKIVLKKIMEREVDNMGKQGRREINMKKRK